MILVHVCKLIQLARDAIRYWAQVDAQIDPSTQPINQSLSTNFAQGTQLFLAMLRIPSDGGQTRTVGRVHSDRSQPSH